MLLRISKYHFITVWALAYLLLIHNYNSFGQEKQVRFTEIKGTKDINLGKINSITQDKYGFIWLSAQNNRSIIRYDGTNMEQIFSNPDNPDDPKALGGFYPECFYTDETGILWIGFYGQGLDRYDLATRTFTHYDHNPDDPNSLANDFVTYIHKDREGKLWIGTYGGLDLLDEKTGTFSHHKYESNNPNSLTGDSVRVIYEDKNGTLWIGTGLGWLPNSRGGLNRYNRDKNNFTQYVHNPNDPNSLINNYVRAILEDSHGNFWVGTAGDGLHTMNRETGKFIRHTYDPNNPDKLSRPPVVSASDRITFIKEDSEGKLWIGTDQNGINRYDPEKKTITHYGVEVDNAVWWMYISTDNQIWITTNGNKLLKVNLDYTPVPAFYGQLRRKYVESDSVRWFGTDNGLIRELQKGTKSTMTYYPIQPGLQNRIVTNWNGFTEEPVLTNVPIVVDKDLTGGILFRTNLDQKLHLLDPTSGDISNYSHEDTLGLDALDINQILVQDTVKWIGTWGNGLIKIDLKNNKVKQYKNDPTDGRSLCDNVVVHLNTDIEGNIWIATISGLQRYNPEADDFSSFMLGSACVMLYTDSKGVLWAATFNGTFYYDSLAIKFRETKINEKTYSIFEDLNNKNLWFGAESGVYKMDSSRNYTSFYKINVLNKGTDKNRNDWTLNEAYRKNGKIYLGSQDNLDRKFYYVFDPEKLIDSQSGSFPYFAELWLNEKQIEPGPDSEIKLSLEQLQTLKLANNQNIFSIRFSVIDFRNRFDNEIYYKLEGFDLDWKETKPNERISFFKIPTGRYTLKIRNSNPDGTWNEKKLGIIISPPFYLTGWAYAFYFILFISIIYVIHRVQKQRVLRKERERHKDHELAQAKEIEKAYKELKATQTQLIQSEKMASLGELTAGIAHEIQNPLNFVNNFSELNRELIEEANEEIENKNFGEVKLILSNINENEAKINNHGKRAESIVKSMLLHSRGNTGQKELTDINSLADEYLRLSYHGFRAKDKSFNADFKFDAGKDLPKIQVVPQDVGRVLLNLINNAFYAVSEKAKQSENSFKPTVIVKTDKNGKEIIITISDNGKGIPENIREKIFQPFFTTKPTGIGTGLGLSLSYDIIKKGHNGNISVESTENSGTKFIITLPI